MTTSPAFAAHLDSELAQLLTDGLYKSERVIASPQGGVVRLADGREVINLCANNYLGLSGHPALVEAGQAGAGCPWLRHVLGPLHLRHTG